MKWGFIASWPASVGISAINRTESDPSDILQDVALLSLTLGEVACFGNPPAPKPSFDALRSSGRPNTHSDSLDIQSTRAHGATRSEVPHATLYDHFVSNCWVEARRQYTRRGESLYKVGRNLTVSKLHTDRKVMRCRLSNAPHQPKVVLGPFSVILLGAVNFLGLGRTHTLDGPVFGGWVRRLAANHQVNWR